MLTALTGPYTIRTTTIPNDCPCRWLKRGDSPWELLTSYTQCPHHGLVDRTARDIEAVLDWLIGGWIIEPPSDLVYDVSVCRRAEGWLPMAAFGRIAERVMEHATPAYLWPIVRDVIATARPAVTAWPSSERQMTAILPYPTVPTGRVLP